MMYGANPYVFDVSLYDELSDIPTCNVGMTISSEDNSDYMLMTSGGSSTNIFVSEYYNLYGTTPLIDLELGKMISIKFSKNVESSEYFEQFVFWL